MKLLRKTSIYYSGTALVVLLLGGFGFYLEVKKIFKEDSTEKLWVEKARIESYFSSTGQLPGYLFITGDTVIFQKLSGPARTKDAIVSDTIMFDKAEAYEEVPSRKITFYLQHPEMGYKVEIVKSLIEDDDLIVPIARALAILILLFLGVLYVVQRRISYQIWKPFKLTLNKIKAFDLSGGQVVLPPSDIEEFSELNAAVNLMTTAIQDDYKRLKEFTENASHEIQTPLAIIQNKLEMLIQTAPLNEEQMQYIQSVYEASSRLARLNKSLVLLAKIENEQFIKVEKIDFTERLNFHLNEYKELFTAKNLRIEQAIEPGVFWLIHPELADILISNLLTNAIKHNVSGGEIKIALSAGHLSVLNTGHPPEGDTIDLFARFKKRQGSASMGLGLSIVKKICDVSNAKIHYSYLKGWHHLELSL
jgi:signal transduction histidine kinase